MKITSVNVRKIFIVRRAANIAHVHHLVQLNGFIIADTEKRRKFFSQCFSFGMIFGIMRVGREIPETRQGGYIYD